MARTSISSTIVLLLTACVSVGSCGKQVPAPAPAPAPQAAPAPVGDLDLKAAAQQIAGDLGRQIGPGSDMRTLVIDPMLDRATGQQTGVSLRLQNELNNLLGTSIVGVKVLPFDADGATQSRLV